MASARPDRAEDSAARLFQALGQNVEAFNLLIRIHDEHYQFYSNMFVALAIAYACFRVNLGTRRHGFASNEPSIALLPVSTCCCRAADGISLPVSSSLPILQLPGKSKRERLFASSRESRESTPKVRRGRIEKIGSSSRCQRSFPLSSVSAMMLAAHARHSDVNRMTEDGNRPDQNDWRGRRFQVIADDRKTCVSWCDPRTRNCGVGRIPHRRRDLLA